ncbi:MAG: potassium channel family protein [Acidimicrobiia bacterium]
MTYGSRSTPTAVERWLEDRLPGYRFGAVLVLLLITFVFTACGLEGSWARVVNVFLTGLTLLAALLASRTGRRLFRVAALVVFVALVGAIGATAGPVDNPGDGLILLNLLLVAAAPVVIARALWKRQIVDVNTVLGAICIYVLIGMFFSFLYTFIGAVGDVPFFAQTNTPTIADFLYFSFITLCTVGYGDFTPAQGLGRSLASSEGLVGQLYLVTIVAVVVSRMARVDKTQPSDESPGTP